MRISAAPIGCPSAPFSVPRMRAPLPYETVWRGRSTKTAWRFLPFPRYTLAGKPATGRAPADRGRRGDRLVAQVGARPRAREVAALPPVGVRAGRVVIGGEDHRVG